MAKISYKALLLPVAIFAIVLGPSLAGSAFADDKNGMYSHSHITASWDNGLVCGDHRCSTGQTPQYPVPVVPIRGH